MPHLKIATYRIVHKFEELLLKLVARKRTLHGVEIDVRLQPGRLFEGDDAMDDRQLHSWKYV